MISAPDRQQAVTLIHDAVAGGASVLHACGELALSPRTYQRWTQGDEIKTDGRPDARRPTPANKLSPEERQQIVATCNQASYQRLPPSQIVPALADQAIYLASEASFYRVLREAEQLQHRGKGQAPRTVTHPTSDKATGPNQVWSWDITFLRTTIAGHFLRLYLVLDIYSRKIVGWEIHDTERAMYAAQLIRQACLAEGIREPGLVLHADNGSPMKGATMLVTLQHLGVVPSFSRPSVSNDNPYSESLFGTMKDTPTFPAKPFANIEAAREWVHEFVGWYNTTHRHSGIQFVTPAERHSGQHVEILQQRTAVYEAAKHRHPERWSRDIRNWTPAGEVWLNPEKTTSLRQEMRESAA